MSELKSDKFTKQLSVSGIDLAIVSPLNQLDAFFDYIDREQSKKQNFKLFFFFVVGLNITVLSAILFRYLILRNPFCIASTPIHIGVLLGILVPLAALGVSISAFALSSYVIPDSDAIRLMRLVFEETCDKIIIFDRELYCYVKDKVVKVKLPDDYKGFGTLVANYNKLYVDFD